MTAPLLGPIEKELRALEKRRMVEALQETNYVITRAARLISMPERTFYKKMKEYGIVAAKLQLTDNKVPLT